MTSIRWEDALKNKNLFIGGQLAYSHLGDFYRAEVSDIEPAGHECVYVRLAWTAMYYGAKWYGHEGTSSIEAPLSRVLKLQDDGGYQFSSFIMSDTTLYPKDHPANIKLEDVEPALIL